MMYTELYSFEGTAATDAEKTTATLKKAEDQSRKLLRKHNSAAGAVINFLQSLIPGTHKAGNK